MAINIYESKKDLLDKLQSELSGDTILQEIQCKQIAQFWLDAAQDRKVCARLQAEGLPIMLYRLIKEKDAKESKRIIKDLNTDLLQLVMQIILKVSAGHTESESKLSMELIEDTSLLAEVRDKTFIYKVLLPLIKNEVTIPVTLFDQIK